MDKINLGGGIFFNSELDIKKPSAFNQTEGFKINPGDDLLSHAVSRTVPSALQCLTSVFGMGTGVSTAL